MLKLPLWFLAIVCLCLPTAPVSWAIDFTVFSTQELYELKGAVQNAPEQEQKAYEQEWHKRLQTMTGEEKKLYVDSSDTPGQAKENSSKEPKPYTPGRGYDQQGTGGVIYGGAPSPVKVPK